MRRLGAVGRRPPQKRNHRIRKFMRSALVGSTRNLPAEKSQKGPAHNRTIELVSSIYPPKFTVNKKTHYAPGNV